jgi:ferritin
VSHVVGVALKAPRDAVRENQEELARLDAQYARLKDHNALAARVDSHDAKFERIMDMFPKMHQDNQTVQSKIAEDVVAVAKKVERILGKLEGTAGS